MNLKDKIEQDIVEALKAHDEKVLSTLRMLKSAVKNSEIQKQQELKDEDVSGVIQNQIKSRQDSVALYEKGDRPELAAKEKTEIEILEKYLPEQIDEAQICELVKKVIADTNASGIQDMGKVMGILMEQVKGKADGSLVSKIVKEELEK